MADHPVRLARQNGFVDILDDDVEGIAGPEYDDAGPLENDFDHLLRLRHKAGTLPDGRPADDFEKEVQVKQLQEAEEEERNPYVRINPRIETSILGNEILIEAGGASGERDAVYWSGEDDDARSVSVVLANPALLGDIASRVQSGWPTSSNAAAATYNIYRPYAIIRYGTRGGTATAAVDIGRGCQVTLVASAVYVRLGMDLNTAGTNVNANMLLSAMLAFGPKASSAPVTRTRYIDSLAAAGTSTVIIPAFATQLLPLQRSDVSGSLELDIRDAGGTTIQYVALAGSQVMDPIPLANDAYDILVTNAASPSPTVNIRLVFGLNL